MAAAQLSQNRLERERQQWRDDERQEGEPRRDPEQYDDVDDDHCPVLKRARHDLGDDQTRLLRVRQHRRHDLAGLGALEIPNGQPLQMTEDRITQVARDVFLETRSQLTAEPDENVFREYQRENYEDDGAQRRHRVGRIEQGADRASLDVPEPAQLPRNELRLLEERVQERDQQRKRKRIENRRDDVARGRRRHSPRVRMEKCKQAAIDAHGRKDRWLVIGDG